VIAKWHKKVGDTVKSGDLVAEVETDKATMDFESFQEGTLLYVGIPEGQAAPVDSVIAVIGAPGEDYQALLTASPAPAAEKAAPVVAEAAPLAAAPAASASVTPESLGATVIRMPLLSDTMKEGVIAEWHKKVGDKIKSDDALADVETDKATMEVTAYAEGTLLYVGVEKGKAAQVNDIIAIVGKEGTDVTPLLTAAPSTAAPAAEPAPVAAAAPIAAPVATPSTPAAVVTTSDDSRVKASPLARKIAQEKGIDLRHVQGTAEGGRIVKKDIDGFVPGAAPVAASSNTAAAVNTATTAVIPTFVGEEKYSEVPVSQMRKVIAKRLGESLFTAPHFYLTISVNMESAMAARTQINAVAPVKVSFNDIVIKAVANALKKHPAVNSSWGGDTIRFNEHTNIGVAMAVEDGLLVPVVRFADGKSLSHISTEVKEFGAKAKAKKLQPADWEGSTFTVSNLGMFGIDEFTSIINSPDGAILSVGAIQVIPVVKNGAVVPGNVMKLTLGCDHRVVDGATGAAFLQTLKGLLEEPIRLLA
jgi:pyruvate dehydrogenase E2 component (dihydrolipoamide acetyltransferase)